MAQFSSPFDGGIGGKYAGGRRGSAVSILLPSSPAAGGAGNSLSPNSAFPDGFNPHRRRNSYAAGVVPEVYVNEKNAGGRMSPSTLAQQQQNCHHNGMAHSYSSQQHLLDPSAAYHRRRLPPTPLDLANGRLSGSNETIPPEAMVGVGGNAEGIVRRSSSPRVLPTPPTPKMQNSPVHWPPPKGGNTTSSSSPTDCTGATLCPSQSVDPFGRSPSSRRRRLPAEPIQQAQQNQQDQCANQQTLASLDCSLPPIAHKQQCSTTAMNAIGRTTNDKSAIACDGEGPLLRSLSTRSARGQNGRLTGLSPSARQQQSLEFNEPIAANSGKLSRALSSVTNCTTDIGTLVSNRICRSNNSNDRSNVPKKSIGSIGDFDRSIVPQALAPLNATTNDLANKLLQCSTTTATVCHQKTAAGDVTVPMAAMALTPPGPQKLSTVSAPTTPREMQQKEQKNAVNLANLSSTRKYSSDSPSVLNDLAAISSLNLQRNGSGSMAHLLEQQHILRREFTTTPSSDGAISAAESAGCAHSNSNSSSLSPSIEQVAKQSNE